jgi:hypothetical protein
VETSWGEVGAWSWLMYLGIAATGCLLKWRQVRLEASDRQRIARRLREMDLGL